MEKVKFIKVTVKGGKPVVVPASNAAYYKKIGAKVETPTAEEINAFFPSDCLKKTANNDGIKKIEALETELQTTVNQKENLELEVEALKTELKNLKGEKEAQKPDKK